MLYEFDHQQIQSLVITAPADPAPVTEGPTDEQLMTRIQDRDESALTILYHRHSALFRTVLGRVVNNSHDVDDLLDAAFLEVWNRAPSYDRSKGKPLGWMITIARRRAIDKVRRRQAYDRAEERLRLATDRDPEASWHEGGDDQACARERAEIFQRLMQSLPEAQRDAVKLAYYDGLSQREIAARLQVPLGTIKTRLELGVRKLRTALLAIGGAEEWSLAH
jgi:RNA polymerase sigma-70 factor, ECF subfamily